MKINFEVIPHKEQRYETCGDWWMDSEGTLQIRASRLSESRFSKLIIIHEIVEFLLEHEKRGGDLKAAMSLVEETDIFDNNYEDKRRPDDKESEPGCEPQCPVYEGHMAASAIEHLCAMLLGVNYNTYADEVASLSK